VWSGDTALEKLCRCCSSRRDIPAPRAVIILSEIAAAAATDLSPPRFVTPTVGVERADADDGATVTSERSVAGGSGGGCSDLTDPAVISTAVRGGACRPPARTSSLLE
jgi:hypothetical protein